MFKIATNLKLNVYNMKYWTMGAPVAEKILINRKDLPPTPDSPAVEVIAPVSDPE